MTIAMRWNGEALEPTSHTEAKCQESFEANRVYAVDVIDARSQAAHSRFFAVVNELWHNLPERMMHDYPTSEHLRKRGLVETGFCTEQVHVCKTKAEAQRTAALIRSIHEYSIVVASENVVKIYAPMTQRISEMGSKQFYQSAEKVEGWIRNLIDTEYKELA